MPVTKNLGVIAATFRGTSPPTNTDLVWIDTNTNPDILKAWDGSAWTPLSQAGQRIQTYATAPTTSGDEFQTGITVATSPKTIIGVKINGLWPELGDGSKATDCYFSDDGGTTAKSFGNIVAGDEFIWNSDIANYPLDSNFRIGFFGI